MRMKLITIAVTAVLLTSPPAAFSQEKLIFAVDLIRHGDRTPACEIPNSPHHWNEGLGELTAKGIEQEITLGKQLRQLYVSQYHLLPEKYVADTIYVRSTAVNRTKMSANSILLGLYPRQYRSTTERTIPIHSANIHDDELLVANPGYNIIGIIKRYIANYQTWKTISTNHQHELQEWSEKTGLTITNLKQLDCLADNLNVRNKHGIPLPYGITREDAQHIINLSETAILDEFNHVSFPMGKNFLKTVNDYMTNTVKDNNKLKYVLYVGHDSTLMSVMHTLQVNLKHTPDYASRINFSLYSNDNSYYVKITYNGKPINISSCRQNICSIKQLAHLAFN